MKVGIAKARTSLLVFQCFYCSSSACNLFKTSFIALKRISVSEMSWLYCLIRFLHSVYSEWESDICYQLDSTFPNWLFLLSLLPFLFSLFLPFLITIFLTKKMLNSPP